MPGLAWVAQPLTQLTIKGISWQWRTEEEEQAFDQLEDWLANSPDPIKEYILVTDVSDHNVGAVLSQV